MSKTKKIKHYHNTVNTETNHSSNKLAVLPLVIIISFIPFIIRMKIYDTGLSGYPWFTSSGEQVDFFLYYRGLVFVILAVLMTLFLLWGYVNQRLFHPKNNLFNPLTINGKLRYTAALIPLTAYALLALLSTVLSRYSAFGFSGIYEQFESVFVLLAYCITVFYAFLFVNTEDNVKFIIKWLLISVFLLSLVGFTQALGHDIYSTVFVKKLVIPSALWEIINEITYNFEKNRVYMTFYNPNYVGTYTALIVPIILVLLLFAKEMKQRIAYMIAIISLILCLVGSWSRTGFVSLCVSFIFFIILFRRQFLKYWKISAGLIGVILVAFFTLNALMGNIFFTRITSMFSGIRTPQYTLSSILTNDDNVAVIYNGNTLYTQSVYDQAGNASFKLSDDTNKPIDVIYNESSDSFTIDDIRFNAISIKTVTFEINSKQKGPVSVNGFDIVIDGADWYFSNQINDGTYYYYNTYGRFDKIKDADSALFTEFQNLGSGRGYIWSRTIPLLKDKIILGSGADSFVFEYPQNDYVGRYNYGFLSGILTKPHNMYLQIAVQTGILSLIAFLTFYGIYFVSCIRLYIKNSFESYLSQIGAAIFIGTIGFMVSGLFNDSTVTVSPVFWALTGIGLSINYKLKSLMIHE